MKKAPFKNIRAFFNVFLYIYTHVFVESVEFDFEVINAKDCSWTGAVSSEL